jgi:hypothetical protein
MQHVRSMIWIASQKSFIVDAAVGEPHQAHFMRGAKREESFSLMQQQALLFLSLPRVCVLGMHRLASAVALGPLGHKVTHARSVILPICTLQSSSSVVLAQAPRYTSHSLFSHICLLLYSQSTQA